MRKPLLSHLVVGCLIALTLSSGAWANPTFEELMKKGDGFIAQKKYVEAVKTFDKLVYFYPGRPDAYNALGYACYLDQRYDRAILQFKQALSLDPYHSLSQKNLIAAVGKKAIEQTKDLEFSEALSLLTSTEALFPGNPQTLVLRYSIGQLQFYRSKEEEGFKAWKAVAERVPDSGTAKFMKGYAAHQAGKYQEAIPHYKEALAKVPDEAVFRNYFGLCLAEAGKVEEGLAQLNKAAQKKPPYLDLYLSLAQLYQRQGKIEPALMAVKSGRNLRPDFASVHLWLAALYRAMGDQSSVGKELGLATAGDKRPSILVYSTAPGQTVWVDSDKVGVTPVGTFVTAGKHRLKVQERGKSALTSDFVADAGKVVLAQAGETLQVEQSPLEGLVPSAPPAPGFALRDQSNKYWRSFLYFHDRPVVLLFFNVSSGPVPESLTAMSDLCSKYQEKISCAVIHSTVEKKNKALSQMMSLPANFARLFDDGSVTVKYGLERDLKPTLVIVDLDGYISHTAVGPEAISASAAKIEEILAKQSTSK